MSDDIDTETLQRCCRRYEQLRSAVLSRKCTGRPGDGWFLSSIAELPEWFGGRQKVLITATDDGNAFDVLVFNAAGNKIHSKAYKGIDAAFRNGEKFADTDYPEA